MFAVCAITLITKNSCTSELLIQEISRCGKYLIRSSTKLPIRQSFKRRSQEYKDFDQEVMLFAKYRDVAGVKWPFDIRRDRNGEKIYEIYSDSVEIDKDLKDDLFALPGNIKILPKAK